MPSLHLRNVPDEVILALKRVALESKVSLRELVIEVLRQAVAPAELVEVQAETVMIPPLAAELQDIDHD